MSTIRRGVLAAMVLSMVVGLAPVATASPTVLSQDVSVAWAQTYLEDAYEAGSGDDGIPTARDITSAIANAGADYTEAHTFDKAYSGFPWTSDEDWFKFTVGATDFAAGNLVYLFEAVPTTDGDVQPMLEIYGPGPILPLPHDPLAFAPPAIDPGSTDNAWNSLWFEHYGTSLEFRPAAAGEYFVRVRPYGDNTGSSYFAGAGEYTFRAKAGTLTRLAGSDRYGTAVKISRERFTDGMLDSALGWSNTLHTVVLASGQNYPDALAGSFLAGVVNGPILLTRSTSLPAVTATELQRLAPDRVLVLGGEGAVSPSVLSEVEGLFSPADAPVIDRVSGADRVETSVEIAMSGADIWFNEAAGALTGFCFVANARNFPDALSASSMSAAGKAPILLTDSDTLDPRVTKAIDDLSLGDVIIVGGTGVISSAVESQLVTAIGGDSTRVMRIAGENRYATSAEFAAWMTGVDTATGFVGTPGNPNALVAGRRLEIGIATGQNFPDALAAGPMCGSSYMPVPAPLLLTPSASTTPWIYNRGELPANSGYLERAWAAEGRGPIIDKSFVFGGESAVSAWTWWELDAQSPG